MTDYRKLDDYTLQASSDIADSSSDWGGAKLRRIFNFKARQVVTLYERGGLQSYYQPQGYQSYSSQTGFAAAVTSAMQIQSFRDFESTEEITEMHQRLVDKGGKPPALDDIFPNELGKTNLKPR